MQRRLDDYLGVQKTRTGFRLPHHTSFMWRYAKPKLMQIATGMQASVEDILETMCDLAVYCRMVRSRRQVDITSLYQFLEEAPQHVDTLRQVAGFALDLEIEFRHVGFTQRAQMLVKGIQETVWLSQKQVRCLLALMCWCCLPK